MYEVASIWILLAAGDLCCLAASASLESFHMYARLQCPCPRLITSVISFRWLHMNTNRESCPQLLHKNNPCYFFLILATHISFKLSFFSLLMTLFPKWLHYYSHIRYGKKTTNNVPKKTHHIGCCIKNERRKPVCKLGSHKPTDQGRAS